MTYLMVEQWIRDSGTVEHLMEEQSNVLLWRSGTEMVEEWNISWWNSRTSHKGTVEHVMLEQCNRDGRTGEQKWRNSTTEMVEQ